MWIIRQEHDSATRCRRMLYSSVFQKFSCKYTAILFRGCACCNTRKNVAKIWRSTSAFPQRGKEIFENKFEERWFGRNVPVAWPSQSPDLNPADFSLWSCLKTGLDHGWEPEGRRQLVQALNAAAFCIRNELRRMQLQHSTVQQLAACT